jgi:hypothetical protein
MWGWLEPLDLDDLDWGSVPAWLGAGSLILAYMVFMRDRTSSERAQADLVGAWATVEYERSAPDVSPRVESGMVTGHVRNGSELPVRVARIAFRIETRWLVVDDAQSQTVLQAWDVVPVTDPLRKFADDLLVPPDETEVWSFEVNVAHTAPEGATQLHLDKGIAAHVDWLLVIDNAGRRWEVRPREGRQGQARPLVLASEGEHAARLVDGRR